jgi:TRAP-type C4-dicarboxylate transport system permease small subunit
MSDDATAAGMLAAPRFVKSITAAVRWLLGALLLGMVLLNVTNAVCRYLFGMVLTGADEILVYAMIWMVMIGMILVTIDDRQIALDFLVNRLSKRPRRALLLLHHVVVAVACGYATVQAFEFTRRVAAIGQTSMALGLPMLYPHTALVVGFAGTALVAALLVISDGAALAFYRAGPKDSR